MKLNRVKMFARKISAADRLVRSPPAFASPRERRSATCAAVRPAGGVSAIGAAGAGGNEAAASAMQGHHAAVKDQPNARPGPGRVPAASTAPNPPHAASHPAADPIGIRCAGPILNGLVLAAAILLVSLEASAGPASTALERRVAGWR